MAAKILRAIAVYPEDAGMAKGYPNKLLEDRISGVEKDLRSLGAVTAHNIYRSMLRPVVYSQKTMLKSHAVLSLF